MLMDKFIGLMASLILLPLSLATYADDKHSEWIEVQSFSPAATRSSSANTGTSKAGPLLGEGGEGGAYLSGVSERPEKLKFELKDMQITGYRLSAEGSRQPASPGTYRLKQMPGPITINRNGVITQGEQLVKQRFFQDDFKPARTKSGDILLKGKKINLNDETPSGLPDGVVKRKD